MKSPLKFIKKHGGYYNPEKDLLIIKNDEHGDWDIYEGDEWAAEGKTKKELVEFANRGWNI